MNKQPRQTLLCQEICLQQTYAIEHHHLEAIPLYNDRWPAFGPHPSVQVLTSALSVLTKHRALEIADGCCMMLVLPAEVRQTTGKMRNHGVFCAPPS